MKEHIDVRGAHPIYFRGSNYVRLVGCNRGINVQDARIHVMFFGSMEEYMRICHLSDSSYVNHVDRRQEKS